MATCLTMVLLMLLLGDIARKIEEDGSYEADTSKPTLLLLVFYF